MRRVALTVWGNRISPVFDAAQTIMVAEISKTKILTTRKLSIYGRSPGDVVGLLKREGVNQLICGAISEYPARLIEESDIELVSFFSGKVKDILGALCDGVSLEQFIMPGCRSLWQSGRRCCSAQELNTETGHGCCGSRKGIQNLKDANCCQESPEVRNETSSPIGSDSDKM